MNYLTIPIVSVYIIATLTISLFSMEYSSTPQTSDNLTQSLNNFFSQPLFDHICNQYGIEPSQPALTKLQALCEQPANGPSHLHSINLISSYPPLQKALFRQDRNIVAPAYVTGFKQIGALDFVANILMPEIEGYRPGFCIYKDGIPESIITLEKALCIHPLYFCLTALSFIICANSQLNPQAIIFYNYWDNTYHTLSLPTPYPVSLLKSHDQASSIINVVTSTMVHEIDVVASMRICSFIDYGAPIISMEHDYNNKVLAIGDSRGYFFQWDYRMSKPVSKNRLLKNSITTLAWSPHGETIAVGGAMGETVLWDIRNLEKPLNILSEAEKIRPIKAIAFHPQGAFIATSTSVDPCIKFFSLIAKSGKACVKKIHTSGTELTKYQQLPLGNTLAFSLSGNELLADWGMGIKSFSFSHTIREQLTQDTVTKQIETLAYMPFRIGTIALNAYKLDNPEHAKLLDGNPEHGIHELYKQQKQD